MAERSHRSHRPKGGGNCKSPPSSSRDRCRRWLFTLNNWSHNELSALKSSLHHDEVVGYTIGEEGRVSPHTPHLQGFIQWTLQKDFTTLQKLLPRAHWLRAKGSTASNRQYCTKEGVYTDTFPEPLPLTRKQLALQEYSSANWRTWQQRVLTLLKGSRESRTIHWYWEGVGNSGKSWLARFLFLTMKCCLASGKKADILHSVVTWMSIHKNEEPDLILLDCKRTMIDYVSYDTLESLKDRFFLSGKYESSPCYFVEHPFIIVFANGPPAYGKMSLDRWDIVEINNSD